MSFKPLTSNTTALKTKPEDQTKVKDILQPQTHEQLLATTSERIHIIYDDSSSMDTAVAMHDGSYKNRQALAAEATTDYLKNCKPHVTAVEIAPLNAEPITMTKNLPLVSTKVKAIAATGGTPLFEFLSKFINLHKQNKYTRALIFTDGSPTDYYVLEQDPGLMARAKELGIPIDFIIIGEVLNLSSGAQKLKELAEASGGTYMQCKDGKAFKEKMKYFAPMLRHMLPSIASQDGRGDN